MEENTWPDRRARDGKRERRGEERRGRCWEKVETERREDGEEKKHLSRITFTFLPLELLNHSMDT